MTPLPRTVLGGIEEYAYSVVDEMRKEGLDLSIITSRVSNSKIGKGQEIEHDPQINHIDSSMLFQRPVPRLRSIPTIVKLISKISRASLVHIHMPYPFIESYVSFFAKLLGKKIVITYHMDAKMDSEEERNRLDRKGKGLLLKRIIENAYYLFSSKYPLEWCSAICSNTKAYALDSPFLSNEKFLKKVHVIYQGIKRELYESIDDDRAKQIRDGYLQGKSKFLVSFVGRLVPYKGIPFLLEAIQIVNKRTDLRIQYVIGGTGPEKSKLEEQARSLALDNVIFVGYVADNDLFNLFRASDLVVSPSISALESTPISLLSSLMAGTPVIGTSIGGTAETIPHGVTGRIIPPKDSDALASAMIDLLTEAEIREIGEKKPLIPLRYWRHVAREYSTLFDKLLSERNIKQEQKIQVK